MFFKLFGRKKSTTCKIMDAVYRSQQAKNKGILSYARENKSTVCITWFPESTSFFKSLFSAEDLDESRVVEGKFFSNLKYPGKTFFCAEHYPLSGREDEFTEQLQQETITFYSAITEPLFKAFGGDKMEKMMKSMGMQEDEVIMHDMVSKSIRNAQRKLAQSVISERPAGSQEQWFQRNYEEKIR